MGLAAIHMQYIVFFLLIIPELTESIGDLVWPNVFRAFPFSCRYTMVQEWKCPTLSRSAQ